MFFPINLGTNKILVQQNNNSDEVLAVVAVVFLIKNVKQDDPGNYMLVSLTPIPDKTKKVPVKLN